MVMGAVVEIMVGVSSPVSRTDRQALLKTPDDARLTVA
jgi:hypothetical protein